MALGMQSREIPDSALSASTSLPDHGPTDARYTPAFAILLRASIMLNYANFSIPYIDIFSR